MKFEKISKNQVRCTLTKKELDERQIRMTDLANGTEKGKKFFHDMLMLASEKCDIEMENTPLTIEALPVSSDCLVLLITKLSEAKTFNSDILNSFDSLDDESDYDYDDDYDEEDDTENIEEARADEIINCFGRISDIMGETLSKKLFGSSKVEEQNLHNITEERESSSKPVPHLCKVYKFDSFEDVNFLAQILKDDYHGENTLYKDPDGKYHLIVGMSDHTVAEFNRIVNIISDFVPAEKLPYAGTAYFEEHYKVIIKDKALQLLVKI